MPESQNYECLKTCRTIDGCREGKSQARDYVYICISICIGQIFFTPTLTSTNCCSSQAKATPYLHLPWPWMGQCWTEFPVIRTCVSQLAVTCHGLPILQIAAIRYIDLVDLSTGAFICVQRVPVYWGHTKASLDPFQITLLLSGIPTSRVKLNHLKMYKSLLFGMEFSNLKLLNVVNVVRTRLGLHQ